MFFVDRTAKLLERSVAFLLKRARDGRLVDCAYIPVMGMSRVLLVVSHHTCCHTLPVVTLSVGVAV